MSFVNMMDDTRWSERDIVHRTESMVRSSFSAEAESILNRKFSGMIAGMYMLTESEQEELALFNTLVMQARAEGDAARADMLVKQQVMDIEALQQSLEQVPADVEILPEDNEETTQLKQEQNLELETLRSSLTQQIQEQTAAMSADALQLLDDRKAYREMHTPLDEIISEQESPPPETP